MFSAVGLFKEIPCPELGSCSLLSCIFSHETQNLNGSKSTKEVDSSSHKSRSIDQDVVSEDERSVKRRRLDVERPATRKENGSELASKSGTSPPKDNFPRVEAPTETQAPSPQATILTDPTNQLSTSAPPSKPVSSAQTTVKAEPLNPRKVHNSPAGHGQRILLVTKLHEELCRLNSLAKNSPNASDREWHQSNAELIKMTLDEEERLAKERPTLYANLIRQRLAAYRKMTLKTWVTTLKEVQSNKQSTTNASARPSIETNLTSQQELAFLPRLVANQTPLTKYGYITIRPSDVDIEEAAMTMAASANWEVCDRCKTRFQVFPKGRADDGVRTTNGPCTYHPRRVIRPARSKTDAVTGTVPDPVHPCCNEKAGSSPGCTKHNSHVFKTSDPGRLALLLQFESVEDLMAANGTATHNITARRALAFDCEMAYTVYGMELIRLTVTEWPSGAPLLDVLVHPFGTILDYNSQFSGVWPENFANAIPYEDHVNGQNDIHHDKNKKNDATPTANGTSLTKQSLRIVSSPTHARSLFMHYLNSSTYILGHALENDLNAVRLLHDKIIDTALLFPHPRGLPFRHALKMLARQHLNWEIQTAGAAGHDSAEDAGAAGELVRFAVKRDWEMLKLKGWTWHEDELVEPST